MALCQMIHEVLRRCDEIVLYNKTRRFDLADLVGSRDRDPQSAYEKTLTLRHQKATLSHVQEAVNYGDSMGRFVYMYISSKVKGCM
jgi:hypothetical protein